MEKHTRIYCSRIAVCNGLVFFSAFNFLETNFLKPCEVHKLAPVFKETRLFFTTQIQCCNLRSRLHLVDFVPSWQLFSRVTQIV